MAYPDLDRDESIILETRNIKLKSISFDAILTSKRIILTDSKKNVLPSQEISLETIRNVETGENAIRDQFLILTTITDTGEKHDTVLTFLRQSGGERKRECNEWAKKLKSLIPLFSQESIPSDIRVPDGETLPTRESTVPVRSSKTIPRPEKKGIEIARPLGKIRDESPVSPIPIETSSLPSGTFCSRCGNRVPYESTYCNHCGTPIKHQAAVNVPAKKPVVPHVQIPVSPSVASPTERQVRPIEQIIHSIEPLIEDSVPRTHPSPLFQKKPIEKMAEPAPAESQPVQPVPTPPVLWPVLQKTESPVSPVQEPAPPEPASPPPVSTSAPDAPASKPPNYLAIGILVIAILAVIGGLVVVANFVPGQSGISGGTPTPAITPLVTKLPSPTLQPTRISADTTTPVPTTTQLMIPPTGVWVRASYPGTYIGRIGTPGNQIDVTDTGDHFYQISTTEGTVSASLQKKDGSADRIILEVYKNGVIVRRESTVTPRGIVDIQLDLKTVQLP